MLGIEGKRNRLVAVDCLIQFLECAIHAFLLSRSIYPKTSFGSHTRFGVTVQICDIKSVKSYIKQVCQSLQSALLHDRVDCLVIEAGSDRFCIELPTDFGKTVFYALPSGGHRSDLDAQSLCAPSLREALIQLDRKLCSGPRRVRGNDAQAWEVYADMKATSVQMNEAMDMPSGWTLWENDDSQRNLSLLRNPIKSVLIGGHVVISTYTDTVDTDVTIHNLG
jgi:hypothetical protein